MTERSLDDSQLSAVEISAASRQIVIAVPGSGKTEVVSALVEQLVEDGMDPSDGILVISFSNAAIHAVDARLLARSTRPVGVQTMDSLASEILRDLAVDDNDRLDFDGRIALATQLLEKDGWDRLNDLEHLVVDEVQDVVGVRADFLLPSSGNCRTRPVSHCSETRRKGSTTSRSVRTPREANLAQPRPPPNSWTSSPANPASRSGSLLVNIAPRVGTPKRRQDYARQCFRAVTQGSWKTFTQRSSRWDP